MSGRCRPLHDALETFTYVARSIQNAGSADEWPGDLGGLLPKILVDHPFAVAGDIGDIATVFGVS